MFIDTHAHIENTTEKQQLIEKIMPNCIILSGVDIKSSLDNIKISQKNKNVYAAIGIHPENVDSFIDSDLIELESMIREFDIVAIGEIGLDYYWTIENKQKQIEIFIKQIELALKYKKPVIIHARNSNDDILNIIAKYPDLSVVLHCYSGNEEITKEFLKLHVMFGVSGVITFKNAEELRDIIKDMPINNILLETDSPYLAPVPYRGTENTPLNIPLIAKEIAKIKGLSEQEVIDKTTANAIRKFDLKL